MSWLPLWGKFKGVIAVQNQSRHDDFLLSFFNQKNENFFNRMNEQYKYLLL